MKVYIKPNGKPTTILRGCVICEAHKYKDDMNYHECPWVDKSSVGNL